MTKQYKQLLPFDVNVRVKDQFKILPLSIMEFQNQKEWDFAYFDQDETELRRSEDAEYLPGLGMSEFSSAVCEFVLRYWSLKNSIVVDPFAGRATRAIISSKLNRKYYGYEISPKTYQRSVDHYKKCAVDPTLFLSDGCKLANTDDNFAHLVMTCPPYGNIEKYESTENQLSDIRNYDDFLKKINGCIGNIHRVLKPGGFCCWIVADYRDATGFKQFSNDSINLFKNNNMISHDTVIIKNNSPFAPLQAGKCASKRITAKTHEYILVFRKQGDLDTTELQSDNDWKSSDEFFG